MQIQKTNTQDDDSLFYGANYKYTIDSNVLSITNKRTTIEYGLTKLNDNQYRLVGRSFSIYPSIVNVTYINNDIILSTIREYDMIICGEKFVKMAKINVIITLTK